MNYDDYELLYNFYDSSDLNEFLEKLIADELLEGAVLGITRQCMAQGVDSLTMRQLEVFDRGIKKFITRYCQRCGRSDIPFSDMYIAYENKGLCDYCNYKMTYAD